MAKGEKGVSRFCPTHWNGLRAAIDERGLGGLVPTSPDEAHSRESFDPLVYAHREILLATFDQFGTAAMHGCPLCNTQAPDWVIPHAADLALEQAKEFGLVGES